MTASPVDTDTVAAPLPAVEAFRGWVGQLDGDGLSAYDQVALIAELERVKGAISAAQARTAEALRRERVASAPQDAVRSVGAEVALARRESPSRGDRFVRVAHALVHEMPKTLAALSAGRIGEQHAVELVRETACLTQVQRTEVDSRLSGVLGRLSPAASGRAAARVAAELDAAAVVATMEAAVAGRRVSVRPAPDGMAYLTVLGPMREVIGAYAALQARARSVFGGQAPDESPEGRGVGALAADTALRLLAGLERGQVQPVEVHLVMTDRSLLGAGDPDVPVNGAARVPGHGAVPAPVARQWVRTAGDGAVWLRRLYTTPDGRDLVAMDSRRRLFTGLLRRMLVLRDERCTTPWCDGHIVHADHTEPARADGPTSLANGSGTSARCNLGKEAPGWKVTVVAPSSRELEITTPAGHTYRSLAPPLLGWGTAASRARDPRASVTRDRTDRRGSTAPRPRPSLLRC